jgi:hypothetical protein
MKLFGSRQNKNYTVQEILLQLDNCAEDFTFPMLDNGYIYPVDSRLSAYRDNERWALIIEVLGFHCRAGGHDGIDNCLHVFGNCLEFEPGTNNANFLYMTNNSDDGDAFDEEYMNSLNPKVKSLLLRGQKIEITTDPDFYKSRGIELEDSPKIMIWEFLRAVNSDLKEQFLATEDEIRQRIPKDLPLLLKLEEWHHNDLADGEMPSQNETFQMIAKVLETGNANLYSPTKEPNNHWRNWPDGGTL